MDKNQQLIEALNLETPNSNHDTWDTNEVLFNDLNISSVSMTSKQKFSLFSDEEFSFDFSKPG